MMQCYRKPVCGCCMPQQLPFPPSQCQQVQVIREHILVPFPYPVYPCSPIPDCDYFNKNCICDSNNCNEYPDYGVNCDASANYTCPQSEPNYPCPWPWSIPRRVHCPGRPVIPGYAGHVPGIKFHGAGRSFGHATMDTSRIMSQWTERCPRLPWRIYEQ